MTVCGKDVVLAWVLDPSTPALLQKTVHFVLMNGSKEPTPDAMLGFIPGRFFSRDLRDAPPLILASNLHASTPWLNCKWKHLD